MPSPRNVPHGHAAIVLRVDSLAVLARQSAPESATRFHATDGHGRRRVVRFYEKVGRKRLCSKVCNLYLDQLHHKGSHFTVSQLRHLRESSSEFGVERQG